MANQTILPDQKSTSRRLRRGVWLSASLLTATGFYCLSYAVPMLRGENTAQQDRDDALAQVFGSETPDEPVSSLVTSAHYLSGNSKTDKQVTPAGTSSEESVTERGFSKLFRWRRKATVPQDSFESDTQGKSSPPAPSSKGKSTANAKVNSTSKPSYTVADAIEALEMSEAKAESDDQSPAGLTTNSDEAAARIARAAAAKPRDVNPLATRRRLLEQIEKAVDEATESSSDAVASKSKEQPQDAEPDFRDKKLKSVEQSSNKLKRNPKGVVSRVAARAETPVEPSVSDQELRSLFEEPEDSESAKPQPESKSKRKAVVEEAAARAARVIPHEAALHAEELPREATPRSVPDKTKSDKKVAESAEVPVEALRFRAKQAKEQGRSSAARYLELAAESIEKNHQTTSQTNELQPQIPKQDFQSETQLVVKVDESTREPVAERPATQSKLPGTRPALEEQVAEVATTKETQRVEGGDRKSPAAGLAKLLPESNDDVKSATTSVDVPGTSQPAPRPEERRTAASSSGALRETVKATEKPDVSQKIRITPRQKFDLPTAVAQTQMIVPKQEIGAADARVPSPVAIESAVKGVPISDESPVPSLIPTRAYAPQFQVTANRPLHLTAPEGWSASKKVASVPVQVPEMPGRTSVDGESGRTASPPKSINEDIKPSAPWPVELNTIEEDPVETRSGPFEVMNGSEVVQSEVQPEPVRDAHYRTEAEAREPELIENSVVESPLHLEPTTQSWRPSWLMLAGTVLLAMIGTWLCTRPTGQRPA